MPDVASSLQNVLDYEGDVETDMYMTFQVKKIRAIGIRNSE